MIGKHGKLLAAAFGMAILILDSRAAAAAAANAVEICIHTVIPSLFPFFLLSGYLTNGLKGGKLIARLFHTDENSGAVILPGLLSGYPVGAKLAAEAVNNQFITGSQGNRLIWFCSQAGPSFLFGMVAAQFGSMKYAWMLWCIQILSTISVSWVIPQGQDIKVCNQDQLPPKDPMGSAISAMASVCGWVIIFNVIIQFLKRWFLWMLPENSQILLCGILEVTNGCLMLSQIPDIPLRFLSAAVMLNFGGICIFMQTVSVAGNLEIKNYLKGKALQTCFAVLYSLLSMGHLAMIFPVLCVLFSKSLCKHVKKSSIPETNGV